MGGSLEIFSISLENFQDLDFLFQSLGLLGQEHNDWKGKCNPRNPHGMLFRYFLSPCDRDPQQAIPKTLNSSKIPQHYLTFLLGR